MDKKKLMLLVGALIVAIGTAFAARTMFAGAAAPKADAAEAKVSKVLVANKLLGTGTIITADAIAYKQWPKEMVQDAYYVEGEADVQKLLGTVVRFPITAGQPVTQGALVQPDDRGFLAAALAPGMRAMTIPVSDKTAVGGFIFPGDHVDLLLSQSVGGDDGKVKVSETILRNLRILATDRTTDVGTADGKSRPGKRRSVTLEVTPRLAEKITVAMTLGRISLVLRSIADSPAEMDKAIATGAVKVPTGMAPDQEKAMLESAMNRPIEGSTTFATGGDVSRFQPRQIRPLGAKPKADTPVDPSAPPATRVPTGPVVRITRGDRTEAVEVH